MKYLLVLGFACDVYKQEPRARIFVGDRFVDEFSISNYSDTLIATRNNFLDRFWKTLRPHQEIEGINQEIEILPPLKFYEIELSEILDTLEVRIEIKNNDSNYTNGFITNSTLIKLQACHFFPLNINLIEKLNKIKNKNRFTENYAWYKSRKSLIFDFSRDGMQWQGKNGQIVAGAQLQVSGIGGDGMFKCKLEKKYGIFIKSARGYSYRFNFSYPLIHYFLNKYIQHANQRNTD
jgi:hypothetical protein